MQSRPPITLLQTLRLIPISDENSMRLAAEILCLGCNNPFFKFDRKIFKCDWKMASGPSLLTFQSDARPAVYARLCATQRCRDDQAKCNGGSDQTRDMKLAHVDMCIGKGTEPTPKERDASCLVLSVDAASLKATSTASTSAKPSMSWALKVSVPLSNASHTVVAITSQPAP